MEMFIGGKVEFYEILLNGCRKFREMLLGIINTNVAGNCRILV